MKQFAKRMVCLLTGILMVLAILTGCSGTPKDEKSDSLVPSSTTEERGVLRIGMECAYAPFNWTQSTAEVANGDTAVPIYGTNDYAYGYDIMVAKLLAEELDMDLEIHKVEWSSIVLGMNAGDYDIILAGMSYSTERDQSVDFTEPYYVRDNVIIVNKEGAYANASGLSDFTGASCTTQIGTSWVHYVPQIPEVEQLTYYETTAEVVMAVSMGTADCGILDEPTALSATLANDNIAYIKLPAEDGFTVPEGTSLNICIAVKEGESALQKTLNDALVAISLDEEKMAELMNTAIEVQPLGD
ncbi:MAG: amino acid ABC transporter substrate-binding protein [Clostridiales bacterium]|nr:MAG: amino acid ABC transporter substrate-binding protein [Clostridiales bacterium]